MNIIEINKPIYVDVGESKKSIQLHLKNMGITDVNPYTNEKHTNNNNYFYENKVLLDLDDAPWP